MVSRLVESAQIHRSLRQFLYTALKRNHLYRCKKKIKKKINRCTFSIIFDKTFIKERLLPKYAHAFYFLYPS